MGEIATMLELGVSPDKVRTSARAAQQRPNGTWAFTPNTVITVFVLSLELIVTLYWVEEVGFTCISS
jgi:hypothetical protein